MDKTCPYCAETIKAAAIKCRYCQSNLMAQSGIEATRESLAPPPVALPGDQFVPQYEALKKSAGLAFFLWFVTGIFGGHRYYLHKVETGLAMTVLSLLFSIMSGMGGAESRMPMLVGLFGFLAVFIWCIADAFRIPGWVQESNSSLITKITTAPAASTDAPATSVEAKPSFVRSAEPISISICQKCRGQGSGDDQSCRRCGHVFA